jgi:hypothetical protein
MKAHCRPGCWRTAGVVNSVDSLEKHRIMHQPVGPIEPGIVDEQTQHERNRQPPIGHGMNIIIDLGPAVTSPAPSHNPRRCAVDASAYQRPNNLSPDLALQAEMQAGPYFFSEQGKSSAGDHIAQRHDENHRCRCPRGRKKFSAIHMLGEPSRTG